MGISQPYRYSISQSNLPEETGTATEPGDGDRALFRPIPVPSAIVANPEGSISFGPPPGSGSISQRYGSGILLSSSKNSKKNIDSYCSVTSLWLFIFVIRTPPGDAAVTLLRGILALLALQKSAPLEFRRQGAAKIKLKSNPVLESQKNQRKSSSLIICKKIVRKKFRPIGLHILTSSVPYPDPNPDPPDPHVFGPPGSISQRHGSGSGSSPDSDPSISKQKS